MSKDVSSVNKTITLDSNTPRRNRKAVAALHTKYFSKIKHYIAYSIGSTTDAEDLTQDVFVEFCKENGRYRENGNPEKYLFGIARNMVRGYYRKRARTITTIPIEEIGTPTAICNTRQQPDPVSLAERQELIKIIKEILVKLSPKSRDALKLHFIDGLNSKEAAQNSGCTESAFRERLCYAIQALQKISQKFRMMLP